MHECKLHDAAAVVHCGPVECYYAVRMPFEEDWALKDNFGVSDTFHNKITIITKPTKPEVV